jgi:uncharacterized membrane protein YgaE (UPF0421/DUF939 family)
MTARFATRWDDRARTARGRLRPSMLPILQTAAAAVIAWYVAVLLLPTDSPTFASIAAVICLGATYGHRPQRAVELIGGVMLGIAVADLLLLVIDTGALQLGLLVILAMTAATLLRGGELFVNEAAISAIILVSLAPAGGGFSADRILEGLVGGVVALAVAAVLFPPHPAAMVGGAAQRLIGRLASTLEEIATALGDADPTRAEHALAGARGLDDDVAALRDALDVARETVRWAPAHRAQRALLARYEATMPQLDFAVRNARVLARDCLRYTRNRLPAPDGLPEALRELAGAAWALGAQWEQPERDTELRRLALTAARHATEIYEREPDRALTEIVGQLRSIAVDLVRAADRLSSIEAGRPGMAEGASAPTEELLIHDSR